MKKIKDQLFWEFSLKLYAEPDVEQALLFLQDHHGFNVNMILFCCWYGVEGQGKLTQKRLLYIDEGIKLWHARIIQPLRRLRKTLKNYSLIKSHSTKNENVLSVELKAEKIEQQMIVNRISFLRHGIKSPPIKAADICKSLLNYCHVKGIRLNDEGVDCIITIVSRVFPKVPLDEIANIISEHFFEETGMSGTVGTQLWLDL